MRAVVVGAHSRREDVEPVATAIEVTDLFLSGVEVSEDQPIGDRGLLLRVAQIRGLLLGRATFIAIRYGVIVHGPQDALAKCAAYLPKWRETLATNSGKVEMTLKVVASHVPPRPRREDFGGGADYLRALHASTHGTVIDASFREAVSQLGTHRWQNRHDGSVECALLVPRDDVDRITAAGEELKRNFSHVPFLLSGPWPLEVFADDHE